MLAFLIYLYTLPIRIQFGEVFIGQIEPCFITGATLLDMFFYQTNYYTIHRLLALGGFMVFPQIISCFVPDPVGTKTIMALDGG